MSPLESIDLVYNLRCKLCTTNRRQQVPSSLLSLALPLERALLVHPSERALLALPLDRALWALVWAIASLVITLWVRAWANSSGIAV